jgi:hypothetical protein
MPTEGGSYPADIDTATYGPESTGVNGDPAEGWDYIKNTRQILENTFPEVTGAVTANQTELNALDGMTASTAELNILDGVAATASELNFLAGKFGVGKILQVLSDTSPTWPVPATYSDSASMSIIPNDTTSKVLVIVSGQGTLDASESCTLQWKVRKDGADLVGPFSHTFSAGVGETGLSPISCVYLDSPTTTEAKTYSLAAQYSGANVPNIEGLSIILLEIGA